MPKNTETDIQEFFAALGIPLQKDSIESIRPEEGLHVKVGKEQRQAIFDRLATLGLSSIDIQLSKDVRFIQIKANTKTLQQMVLAAKILRHLEKVTGLSGEVREGNSEPTFRSHRLGPNTVDVPKYPGVEDNTMVFRFVGNAEDQAYAEKLGMKSRSLSSSYEHGSDCFTFECKLSELEKIANHIDPPTSVHSKDFKPYSRRATRVRFQIVQNKFKIFFCLACY